MMIIKMIQFVIHLIIYVNKITVSLMPRFMFTFNYGFI